MKDNVNELLIERLKEKGLNPEDFKDVLDAIKQPKYGLIWEDHPEHIEERMKYNRPVLREEKDLRIDSGYGHTNNILMEGDNLASLLAMREAGKKVDVIYIDPPYNTGNEFVYNDRIVDKEDSFKHSKWLSFMEKRLKAARDLMTDDGVIFVSIDDNEQANLKLLMDEVFGEENFVASIVVETGNANGPKVTHKNKKIFKVKEYLLFYRKSITDFKINPSYEWTTEYDYEYSQVIYKGVKKSIKQLMKETKWSEKDVLNAVSAGDVFIYRTIRDFKDKTPKYLDAIQQNELVPFYDSTDIALYKTITSHNTELYLRYSKNKNLVDMIKPLNNKIINGKLSKLKGDLWKSYNKEYVSKVAHEGGVVFKNGKKSLKLIKDILNVHLNKNAKVLDFFAGSGTTGHAVLELNKEDGGHRQFILCTNNENNICRDVTYERLRRVINGYTTPKGKEIEGLPANLMYLTVSDTPKENNDVMFDMDENEPLRPHIINNLRLKYHLHHPDELVDNLYRLRNGNTVHYVYFNDYIEDGVEEAILESLDRDKTNIMHTVEGLVHDEAFNMMDDVKDIAGLLNE